MPARPTVEDARAMRWALSGLRSVRRQLRDAPVNRVHVRPPRRRAAVAERSVRWMLRQRHASCLERALVLQAWYSGQGTPREVVIGVTSPEDFQAHAWLDGDAKCHEARFAEILRLSPR
ncbi:MAG: lasso peptide biosynthesis B2 protein [Acidimicrobiales bacterium]